MGTHSVALTISGIFWNLKGEAGYKKFLSTFVDGETKDTKFSIISRKIHDWRNIIAHQWLASSGYKIQYDYNMKYGFIRTKDIIKINPRKYYEQYVKAFSSGSKIWKYEKLFTEVELNKIKERIVNKFVKK